MNTNQGYLLVVEDIPDILQLLKATLTFKGYRVVTARDGEEALDLIQKEHPALIVTDILMPRMDGFNLVHRLRIDPKTRQIPVIFLSATYIAPEDKTFALTIGVTRFIEKPVNFDEFLPTIAELLNEGAGAPSGSLNEKEFYEGYLKRLKTKLDHKNKQIARDQRLLETVSLEEKPAFEESFHTAINEREEIKRLLEQIRERLKKASEQ
jgi:DNA-binding response OmpR family regulator